MTTTSTHTQEWVELADRQGDGLDVRLFWNRSDGRVKVTVTRVLANRMAELDVAPEDAMTAFHHPFAYQRPVPAHRHPITAETLA